MATLSSGSGCVVVIWLKLVVLVPKYWSAWLKSSDEIFQGRRRISTLRVLPRCGRAEIR
jgi:hypothetical protein